MAIAVGHQLGSHEITALIGRGGMGEVYRARDTKLKRDVAIKILPDEFSRDADRVSRFQREAEVLASLNHPNIAAIYDFQEANGSRYLVLELVEGETLSDRIARGPIPVEEALDIAKNICEALEAAHEKRIIHRDLKPANVKITPDGKVKVLDFGLAKMHEAQSATDFSNSPTLLTGSTPGVILGTAAYMSPEQARGRTVDKRTDVWAFGCVLYELLTGKQVFQGETLTDTIAAVLDRQPNWQALPLSTPAKIRDLLRRLLEKDPQRRLRGLGDAGIEIEEALRLPAKSRPDREREAYWVADASVAAAPWRRRAGLRIASVALMILLTAAALLYWFGGRGEAIDSLAILPFVNDSGDPNTEYLSDGITESLINNLAQLPNLKIKSRDSVFRYKGRETDAQTVGLELIVRAILKATITQRGDSLAISAELIDARDNTHIWGQQYNRKLADIFGLQEAIAREITTALRLRLTGVDEKRLAKSYTANPEAYQDYLRGRYWWNKRNQQGFNR